MCFASGSIYLVGVEYKIKKEGWVCFDSVSRYVVRVEYIIKRE